MTSEQRRLPSVDRLLRHPLLVQAAAELGSPNILAAARDELAQRRANGGGATSDGALDAIAEAVASRAYDRLTPTLRPVINATGVIIHTNLGRAPLSEATIHAMSEASGGYSNLEYDLEDGVRGSRYSHLEALLTTVTGAEAGIAVNNNAAALVLVLSALAKDRDVVISRGQLVEIGGGFRIPDVMAQSGARLAEVGTTNRTYLRDFDAAITDATAALLRVHASNFKVIGFVESPSLADMARLAHDRGLLLFDDLGSGCLLDSSLYGLAHEPTPQESLAAGADLVMFSGDKLLGGPQAGIIVGREPLIAALRRHPLARALRMDKATIAGLAATLLHYARGEATSRVPVWRMIAMPIADIERRASAWAGQLGSAEVVEGRSMVGGGSLPEESLPTRLLSLRPPVGLSADEILRRLRHAETPVIARVERDTVRLDPRTVPPEQDALLLSALQQAVGEKSA